MDFKTLTIKQLLGAPEDWHLGDVYKIIQTIIQWAIFLAGGVAIIFVMLGGWQYLTSMGNDEQAQKGKQTLTWAVVGLILIVGAYLIIGFVAGALGVDIKNVNPPPPPT